MGTAGWLGEPEETGPRRAREWGVTSMLMTCFRAECVKPPALTRWGSNAPAHQHQRLLVSCTTSTPSQNKAIKCWEQKLLATDRKALVPSQTTQWPACAQ